MLDEIHHLCKEEELSPSDYYVEKPCVRDPRSPSAVDPRKQV